MSETDLKRSLLDDELFWKEVVDGLSDEQQGRLLAFVESLKAEGQNG